MVRDNWLHRIETGMGMRIIFLAGCARRASGMVFQQPIHELQMMLPAWERRSPDGELLEKDLVTKRAGETPSLPGNRVVPRFVRLVRGLLHWFDMTVEFQDAPATGQTAEAAAGGLKKTENLCGVFDALCYIPALLTNRN